MSLRDQVRADFMRTAVLRARAHQQEHGELLNYIDIASQALQQADSVMHHGSDNARRSLTSPGSLDYEKAKSSIFNDVLKYGQYNTLQGMHKEHTAPLRQAGVLRSHDMLDDAPMPRGRSTFSRNWDWLLGRDRVERSPNVTPEMRDFSQARSRWLDSEYGAIEPKTAEVLTEQEEKLKQLEELVMQGEVSDTPKDDRPTESVPILERIDQFLSEMKGQVEKGAFALDHSDPLGLVGAQDDTQLPGIPMQAQDAQSAEFDRPAGIFATQAGTEPTELWGEKYSTLGAGHAMFGVGLVLAGLERSAKAVASGATQLSRHWLKSAESVARFFTGHHEPIPELEAFDNFLGRWTEKFQDPSYGLVAPGVSEEWAEIHRRAEGHSPTMAIAMQSAEVASQALGLILEMIVAGGAGTGSQYATQAGKLMPGVGRAVKLRPDIANHGFVKNSIDTVRRGIKGTTQMPDAQRSAIMERLGRMGIHGMATSEGDLSDRIQSTLQRIAYNITPVIANATGLGGATFAKALSVRAVDVALNSFLTSPMYIEAWKESGGPTADFWKFAVPQIGMDIIMARGTRGLAETNQHRARADFIKQYAKQNNMSVEKANVHVKLSEDILRDLEKQSSTPFPAPLNKDVYREILNDVLEGSPRLYGFKEDIQGLDPREQAREGLAEIHRSEYGDVAQGRPPTEVSPDVRADVSRAEPVRDEVREEAPRDESRLDVRLDEQRTASESDVRNAERILSDQGETRTIHDLTKEQWLNIARNPNLTGEQARANEKVLSDLYDRVVGEAPRPAEAPRQAEAPRPAEVPKDITYSKGGDAYGKEYQGYIVALDKDNTVVGRLDYTRDGNDFSVRMVEVLPERQRQGIATGLMDQLRQEAGDARITMQGDVATDAGRAFMDRVGFGESRTAEKATDTKPVASKPDVKADTPKGKTYVGIVKNKAGGTHFIVAHDHKSKKNFASELRGNAYKVSKILSRDEYENLKGISGDHGKLEEYRKKHYYGKKVPDWLEEFNQVREIVDPMLEQGVTRYGDVAQSRPSSDMPTTDRVDISAQKDHTKGKKAGGVKSVDQAEQRSKALAQEGIGTLATNVARETGISQAEVSERHGFGIRLSEDQGKSPERASVKKIGKALGVEVAYVDVAKDYDIFEAAYVRTQDGRNVVLVNSNLRGNALNTIAHELGHDMQRHTTGAWNELRDLLAGHSKSKANLSKDLEAVSDYLGELATSRKFLNAMRGVLPDDAIKDLEKLAPKRGLSSVRSKYDNRDELDRHFIEKFTAYYVDRNAKNMAPGSTTEGSQGIRSIPDVMFQIVPLKGSKPGSKDLKKFRDQLTPDSQRFFDVMDGALKLGPKKKGVKNKNFFTDFQTTPDLNNMIKQTPDYRKSLQGLYKYINDNFPERDSRAILERMGLQKDGTFKLHALDKELPGYKKAAKRLESLEAKKKKVKGSERREVERQITELKADINISKPFAMKRSVMQRFLDAMPYTRMSDEYALPDGRKINLGGSARGEVSVPYAERYRQELLNYNRELFVKGKLGTTKVSTIAKADPYGIMSWLAKNSKTIASGDFTTICPQIYFGKGCMYCYRRAAMSKDVNNKLAGEQAWYTGEILKLTQKDINGLNEYGGLRIQSFGDWFHKDPATKTQFIDMVLDAEARGLQLKVITKTPEMADFVGLLKDQGLGKNIFFNLSTDRIYEKGPERKDSGEFAVVNPDRPYLRTDDGDFYWKRGLSIDEAMAYKEKYPWVNIRTVAMTVDEFIKDLADPRVNVVTGYHGHLRVHDTYNPETGRSMRIEIEPMGDAGMPRFLPNGKIDPKFPGKKKVHKRLAEAIEKKGLQKQYHQKSCCITGVCPTCVTKCGASDKFKTMLAGFEKAYWDNPKSKAITKEAFERQAEEAPRGSNIVFDFYTTKLAERIESATGVPEVQFQRIQPPRKVINKRQFALANALGMDREARLREASKALGKTVDSTTKLTDAELQKFNRHLQELELKADIAVIKDSHPKLAPRLGEKFEKKVLEAHRNLDVDLEKLPPREQEEVRRFDAEARKDFKDAEVNGVLADKGLFQLHTVSRKVFADRIQEYVRAFNRGGDVKVNPKDAMAQFGMVLREYGEKAALDSLKDATEKAKKQMFVPIGDGRVAMIDDRKKTELAGWQEEKVNQQFIDDFKSVLKVSDQQAQRMLIEAELLGHVQLGLFVSKDRGMTRDDLDRIGKAPKWTERHLLALARGVPEDMYQEAMTAKMLMVRYKDQYNRVLDNLLKGRTEAEMERITDMLDGKIPIEGELGRVATALRKDFLDPAYEDAVKFGILKKGQYIEDYFPHIREYGDENRRGDKLFANPWMKETRQGGMDAYSKDLRGVLTSYVNAVSSNVFLKPVVDKWDPLVKKMPDDRKDMAGQLLRAAAGQPNAEVTRIARELQGFFPKMDEQTAMRHVQELSKFFVSSQVQKTMGFGLGTALRNTTQKGLAIAEVATEGSPLRGLRYWLDYRAMTGSSKARRFFDKYCWLLHNREAYDAVTKVVEGEYRINKVLDKTSVATMKMFKEADKDNVRFAFYAGVRAALDDGKSMAEAINYGNSVSWRTQFPYDIGRASVYHSPVARVGLLFSSWSGNYFSLVGDWHREAGGGVKGLMNRKFATQLMVSGASALIWRQLGFAFKIMPPAIFSGHILSRAFTGDVGIARALIDDVSEIAELVSTRDPDMLARALELAFYQLPGGSAARRAFNGFTGMANDGKVYDYRGNVQFTLNNWKDAFFYMAGHSRAAEDRWTLVNKGINYKSDAEWHSTGRYLWNTHNAYETALHRTINPDVGFSGRLSLQNIYLALTGKGMEVNEMLKSPQDQVKAMEAKVKKSGLDPEEAERVAMGNIRGYYSDRMLIAVRRGKSGWQNDLRSNLKHFEAAGGSTKSGTRTPYYRELALAIDRGDYESARRWKWVLVQEFGIDPKHLYDLLQDGTRERPALTEAQLRRIF